MGKVHLLNSAVMPDSGYYQIQEYKAEIWIIELREAYHNNPAHFQHYIGYKSTLTYVEQLTGIDLDETNFNKTVLEDGDIFFVIRLKHRVAPHEKKEDSPHIDDFQFFIGRYTKNIKSLLN